MDGELLVLALGDEALELGQPVLVDIVVVRLLGIEREDLTEHAGRYAEGRRYLAHLRVLVEVGLVGLHVVVHLAEDAGQLLVVGAGVLVLLAVEYLDFLQQCLLGLLMLFDDQLGSLAPAEPPEEEAEGGEQQDDL